jgi:hypothetical protein
VDDADVARRPLGFIDDQHLQAQVSHGASKWWDGRIWSVKRLHVHSGTVVATDRAVVTADGGGLTLITPTTAQHLGYGLTDLSAAQVDGDRVTICNTHSALQVDDRFRTRWKFAPIESSFYELTLLDGRHAVVHDSSALSVVDLAHPERLTPVASPLGETSYEPATHLLAVVDRNGGAWFGHYSPTAHTFDKTTPISGIRSVALLDPAVNHGSIAVVIAKDEHEITNEAERETVSEIRGINFAATSPLRAARSYQRPVFLEMYWDPQPDPNPDPAVVLGLTHMKHRPSRDGSLIAEVGSQLEEFGPRQITLRDRAGTVVWSATRRGVTDVVWLPSGELVAFGSGIAKIDVATGALLDRQCGWEFGLWDDDGGPGTGFGAALCEAP